MTDLLQKEYDKLREIGLQNIEARSFTYMEDIKRRKTLEIHAIVYDGRIVNDYPDLIESLIKEHNYFICQGRHDDDFDFTNIVSIEKYVLINHSYDILIPMDINSSFKESMLPMILVEIGNRECYINRNVI